MSAETKHAVLQMVNHIEDKSIEELAAHINEIKQGLNSLRHSDLKNLVKFIFNVQLGDTGFLTELSNDFSKRVSGAYTQHMITLSAVMGKFNTHAKDMADEAKMDIRIIRNTIDKVYKCLCQIYSLQETLEQPMLADEE